MKMKRLFILRRVKNMCVLLLMPWFIFDSRLVFVDY